MVFILFLIIILSGISIKFNLPGSLFIILTSIFYSYFTNFKIIGIKEIILFIFLFSVSFLIKRKFVDYILFFLISLWLILKIC